MFVPSRAKCPKGATLRFGFPEVKEDDQAKFAISHFVTKDLSGASEGHPVNPMEMDLRMGSFW